MARSKKSSPAPEAVVLAPAAPALPVEVTVAGATVGAARNVLARHANLANVPTALAGLTLRVGRPCKVRVPYTVAGVTAMLNHIAIHGPSTGAELAGIANGDLLTYAVRRGWLVPA